ncbi:MAG TPA: methyltransferase, partial [Polyangiales bacterium]|nr:methyltransferase [Polyangiales bacterium]
MNSDAAFFGMVDIITPLALRVAATLRIADRIADGTTELRALARATEAEPLALARLLRFLSSRGVFAVDDAGHCSLGPLGCYLQSSHPSSARAWLDLAGFTGRMDRALFDLLRAVRTGRPAYEHVHGRAFWQDLDAHPEIAHSFDELMAAQASAVASHIVAAHDFTKVQRVIDVGGGNGALLAAIATTHKQIVGSVVDLPTTVARASERFAALGLASRCDVIAGSAFEALPTGADVYLLASVLHNWSDHDATR